ncbi:type VII secretion target [Phytomonospora sp. NPDC050363]|uniref:type VII secretion target n=1 Tax=Phytomonospora sp. NPDC050363 TaxID=3155642 RepID=UPI0033D06219
MSETLRVDPAVLHATAVVADEVAAEAGRVARSLERDSGEVADRLSGWVLASITRDLVDGVWHDDLGHLQQRLQGFAGSLRAAAWAYEAADTENTRGLGG